MTNNTGNVKNVETQTGAENYPLGIRHLVEGRHKAKLGNAVGISQFGVNHTTLEPGCISALRHWHEAEDEFIFVIAGELTLKDDSGEQVLLPGDFAGFNAGVPNGHQLVNNSKAVAVYLEVGTRRPGNDVVHYPDHDIPPVQR